MDMKLLENNNKFQEELRILELWLKSEEGRKTIKESQEKSDEVCKIIEQMNYIDYVTLNRSFTI
jgi:hypothetical protein